MAPHVHVEKCGVSVEGAWTSALQPLHRCLPSLPERWGVSTRNQAFGGRCILCMHCWVKVKPLTFLCRSCICFAHLSNLYAWRMHAGLL